MADKLQIIIQNKSVVRERMNYAWQAVNKALYSGAVEVTLSRPTKSREMEMKYHAMIRDIHQSCFRGNTFDGVKALMVAEFATEMKQQGTELTHPGETVYSHRLKEWVTVRASTRKFRKSEGAAFIEFLYSIGSELNVKWSQKAIDIYNEYKC